MSCLPRLICKCQRTITPHQRSTIGFAGNKLTFVHVAISVLSGNSVSVFWEIWAYIHTAGWFLYQYGQVQTGRQVWYWSKVMNQKNNVLTNSSLFLPLSFPPFVLQQKLYFGRKKWFKKQKLPQRKRMKNSLHLQVSTVPVSFTCNRISNCVSDFFQYKENNTSPHT